LKTLIESLLRRALDALPETMVPGDARDIEIEVQRAREARHGDFATNVAMQLAGSARRNPRELALALTQALPRHPSLDKVEIAGAGFINFFLKDVAYHAEIGQLFDGGADYGKSRIGAGRRVLVRLVLASPATPLHVDHGRQAAYGAVLSNLLEATGHRVIRDCRVQDEAGQDAAIPADIENELAEFGLTFESTFNETGERGFERLLCVCGADHQTRSARRRADLVANPPECIEMYPVQFVTLLRGGGRAPVSTRTGEFVTLRALRAEVGNDAARLFYVMRSNDQHLDFDLELAKARSNDNPLYGIQYAHARVSSVRRQLTERGLAHDAARGLASLGRLAEREAQALVKRLCSFTERLEYSALYRAPQAFVRYLSDLARDFDAYYRAFPFIVEDAAMRDARLTLAFATGTVIHNGLTLLCVSAPDIL
jgi:arginyl-tRNA synthetase